MSRFTAFIIVSVLACVLVPAASHAQATEAVEATTEINARVLPTIWYSTLSIRPDESIVIYGAIQNNSGVDFSGTAIFLEGDREISRVPFSSLSGVLEVVSARWKASVGYNAVRIRVETKLPDGMRLVSDASDSSRALVTPEITVEKAKEVASQAVSTAFSSAVSFGSDVIGKASEAIKEKAGELASGSGEEGAGVGSGSASASVGGSIGGAVLGTSTFREAGLAGNGSFFEKAKSVAIAWGKPLAKFLIENWVWTLSAIAAGSFVLWLRRRGEREEFEE